MLAVAGVGPPDYQGIEDVGMRLECSLDLLGVNLLAAAVDRHHAAAQHGDRAVRFDLGVVAWDGVADAVDGPERLCGLLLVFVVADRDVALLGDEAAHARPGLDLVAVLVEDDGAGIDRPRRAT